MTLALFPKETGGRYDESLSLAAFGKGVLTIKDDLWRPADQFPLGSLAGRCEGDKEPRGGVETRPFGLRHAVVSNLGSDDSLDLAALDYDIDRQVAVMRDGGSVLPAFKHTNNRTSTSTGADDRKAADRDSDVGGD